MKKTWMFIASGVLALTVGCSKETSFTSEEVISNILKDNKKVVEYYGEGTMVTFKDDKKSEEATFKEWAASDGKRKFQITDGKKNKSESVNDGKNVIAYDVNSKTAYKMKFENENQNMTEREKLVKQLEKLSKSHTYQVVGDEKVSSFDTYHIKVKAKTKDSLIGDFDLWVEKDTWVVIKSTFFTGDVKTETLYTKLDKSPKFDNKTFTLSIPKDVKIQSIEDIAPKPKEISQEEAEKMIGQPYLLWKNTPYTLDKIEVQSLKGEIKRDEFTFYYSKDQAPALTVSVFKTPSEKDTALKQTKPIRNTKGDLMKDINCITWDEDGLRYSILVENPQLSLDDVIKETKEMVLSIKK